MRKAAVFLIAILSSGLAIPTNAQVPPPDLLVQRDIVTLGTPLSVENGNGNIVGAIGGCLEGLGLTGAQVIGSVEVIGKTNAPDFISVRVNLGPNCVGKRVGVFLAEDNITGSLPTQFLGEFTTIGPGLGAVSFVTEVVNAHAQFNDNDTDGNGSFAVNRTQLNGLNLVGPTIAGARGNGSQNIALDFIRIYLMLPDAVIDPNVMSAFGPSELVTGGTHVGSTLTPMPGPACPNNSCQPPSQFIP